MNNQMLRNFGLIFGAIVAVLFGLLLPWLFTYSIPLWPWIVSAILCFSALLQPSLLAPIYKGWMTVGLALGWINTCIILWVIFHVLLLPIGLLIRLFGKDPMARKLNRGKEMSYRTLCSPKNIQQMKEPY
jgi:predicted membrane protein